MKSLWTVLALVAAVGLAGGLEISIQEGTTPNPSTVVELQVNNSRSINLVPTLSYRILCTQSAGGFDGSSIPWYRDDVAVSTTDPGADASGVYAMMDDNFVWALVVRRFSVSLTDTYSCRMDDVSATLVIGSGNPVIVAGRPYQAFDVSERFATLAAFISGVPAPTVQWFNGGTQLTTSNQFFLGNIHELAITTVRNDSGGEYICRVNNSAGMVSDTFTVSVNVPPAANITPSTPQMIRNGSTLTLVCYDSTGIPPPTFAWDRDGVAIAEDDRVSITLGSNGAEVNSNLTISPVLPSDNGTYNCIATNVVERFGKKSVDVAILFPPIVVRHSPPQDLWFTGDTVILQARVESANPSTGLTVVWRRVGSSTPVPHTEVEVTNVTTTVYQVEIPSVGEDQIGTYVCEVNNSIGTGRLEFEVALYVAPSLLHVTPRNFLIRNMANSTTLSLRAVGALPPVEPQQVSWRLNSSLISTDGPKYTGIVDGEDISLVIRDALLRDSGLYMVIIAHPDDTRNLTFQVDVLNPPLAPDITFGTIVDACTARFELTLPQSQPYDIAAADYAILESLISGETWMQVANETSSGLVDLRIPGNGVGTTFRLRGRSGNIFVGEGDNFELGDSFPIYQSALIAEITAQNILGQPVSPTSIRISWSLPTQNCFNFTSFEVSCTVINGAAPAINSTTTSGMEVVIEGLTPSTFYNCSVTSTLRDLARGVITTTTKAYMRRNTYTFPNYPPAFDPPKLYEEIPPTTGTITVEFVLPENNEDISHYQVIVLRLNTPEDLPSTDPDLLYPAGYTFATYQDVHGPDADEMKTFEPYIAAEVEGAGFSPVFTVGDGTRSDLGYVNGKLSPGAVYTFVLRAFPKTVLDFPARRKRQDTSNRQYTVFTSSDFFPPSMTAPIPPPTGPNQSPQVVIIVPIVVVCAFILIGASLGILLILFYFWRTAKNRTFKLNNTDGKLSVDMSDSSSCDSPPRFSQTDTPDLGRKLVNGNNFEMDFVTNGLPTSGHPKFEPSGPISRENFESHVEKFDANRQLLFQEEYDWISAKSPWNPSEASNHPLNDDKNRYSNITAFDHTRVVLSKVDRQECSDYINANYIAGHKHSKEYIATQGPLEQTVVDFWRMVWEQNSATIIMLTNLVELGKVKCSQYWPNSNKVIYGNIKVTLEHSVVLPDYTIRNLTVESVATNESRTVLQFHYTKWPDYGTPKLAAPLLNFLRAVRSSNPSDAGPPIVHCSAGVGRSGTVLAIDYCLQQLESSGSLDIRGFVSRMREQRNYMVQTEQQYTFIHYAVLEAITYGNTSFVLTEFRQCLEKLQQVNGESGQTLLSEEYGRLGTVKTMVKKSSFQQRIKRKGAPPRHFDSSFHGSSGSTMDNYSAHFLDGYFQSKQFIVCDGPSEDTVIRFWQMVWDEDCAYVVMLTPQDTEQLFSYWPKVKSDVHHGNIVVEVVNESAEHLHTRREIKLTNSKVGGISHHVVQYQFIGWTTQYLPGVPDFVSFVVDILKGAENLEKNRRILIHDIKSLGPSGIMCSLCHCIEKIRLERVVDVFQAVQRIQLQRPGSIESLQQYAFIYDCVYEFIRTHSENNTPC